MHDEWNICVAASTKSVVELYGVVTWCKHNAQTSALTVDERTIVVQLLGHTLRELNVQSINTIAIPLDASVLCPDDEGYPKYPMFYLYTAYPVDLAQPHDVIRSCYIFTILSYLYNFYIIPPHVSVQRNLVQPRGVTVNAPESRL